jgi:hypothetical protein
MFDKKIRHIINVILKIILLFTVIIGSYLLYKYINNNSKENSFVENISLSDESTSLDTNFDNYQKIEEDFKINVYGNISLKEFYGSPNYGENPETDNIETYYVLKLIEPIIISEYLELEKGEEIQLILNNNIKRNFNTNLNYNINGMAFFAQTGHHHTKIILVVDDIIINE